MSTTFEANDLMIDPSASQMPQLLQGHNSAAAASVKLFQICMESLSGFHTTSKHIEPISTSPKNTAVHFDFSMYDPEQSRRLPNPAPPPKLHYATFWRSVTRRMVYKHSLDARQLARESVIRDLSKTKI
jgi:hypothetical protein